MTKEEAIRKAADWWVKMIYAGVWDNGDATTELLHSFTKSLSTQLKLEHKEKIREGFVKLLEKEPYLYNDYHCSAIDAMYKELGLEYSSSFHAPQKATRKQIN